MADYAIFNDCLAYIQSRVDLKAKIIAIDAIIQTTEDLILQQVLSQAGGTAMYELDDGQVRIKVNYRSIAELTKTMTDLETVKQRYLNRLNGRRMVLRDASTFRGWGGFGCGC